MPIGTIIGWLIGQIFVSFLLAAHNSKGSTQQVIGTASLWLAIFALTGTVIELIVR
jgi:hypothetical protein